MILTFLIPVAYVGFYPAAYFMDGSFSLYALFQPVIVAIFGGITLLVWKTGIRKYQSTGN
jgi:ABC-2 type transport system permease protein